MLIFHHSFISFCSLLKPFVYFSDLKAELLKIGLGKSRPEAPKLLEDVDYCLSVIKRSFLIMGIILLQYRSEQNYTNHFANSHYPPGNHYASHF